MSHAKREVGAACALLLFQRRIRDNRLSAAPLRAYPRRSTWPITRQRERSWAREKRRNQRSDPGDCHGLQREVMRKNQKAE